MGTIAIDFGIPLTITTNAQQNAFLARLLARENVRLATQTPPGTALTQEQWLRDVIQATLVGYRQQNIDKDKVDAQAAFAALSGAQQNQVVTLLGGNNPFV